MNSEKELDVSDIIEKHLTPMLNEIEDTLSEGEAADKKELLADKLEDSYYKIFNELIDEIKISADEWSNEEL